MAQERYLPVNYEMPDGSLVRSLYVKGEHWQLYATSEGGQALAVDAALHERWMDGDWLEPGIFAETDAGCFAWGSRPGSLISSMDYGPYPSAQEQAAAFVRTLKRSRERFSRASFGDALYIAQFSALLPTFSEQPPADDALVAGRWLTGGINVPVTDTARMRRYAPWLPAGTLERLLDMLELTADAGASGVLDAPVREADAQPIPQPARSRRAEGTFALAGRPELERFFREEIIDVIDREAAYKRMGIDFPGPALLYGPPGCGKTYAVERLTEYLGWPVYHITSGSIGSKFVHETSRKISELFDQAIANAPSVIVIDELEAFLSSRESARSSGEIHLEEVAEFLRRIPDASKHRVLLFGMTNMLEAIDKAILRRGRFDHLLEVGMPSEEEIRALLEHLLAPLPVEDGVDLAEMARRLKGTPISDVAFVVRQAGRLAVRAGQERIDGETLRQACDQAVNGKKAKRRIGFASREG